MGQIDFNKVWANFIGMITGHYMDFGGRLGRAQYWYFAAVWAVVFVIASIIGDIVHVWLLMSLIGLAFALPLAAASARRIQDTGNNGQLALLWLAAFGLSMFVDLLSSGFYISFLTGFLVQLIDAAAVLMTLAIGYFAIQPGTPGDNQYGAPPPAWTPNAA